MMKIRYYGHVDENTGYGRAAEELCLALLAVDGPSRPDLEIRPIAPRQTLEIPDGLPLARYLRDDTALDPRPDVVIVHTFPLDCVKVIEQAQLAALGVPIIAYTTWEASSIPPIALLALQVLPNIWVPSEATRTVLDAHGLESSVVPHAFDEETASIALDRDREAVKDDRPFRFYYAGAWSRRKNPLGVLLAYAHAFDHTDPVELLLHCPDVSDVDFMVARTSLGIPPERLPLIKRSNKRISDHDMLVLHRDIGDVFVSASHGEAWNFPAFDAFLAGRNIIVPGGQGSDDYLLGDMYGGSAPREPFTNAVLYGANEGIAQVEVSAYRRPDKPAALELAVKGAHGVSALCTWQEPDLLQLGAEMQQAFAKRRRHHDRRDDYDPAGYFGRTAVGNLALSLLEQARR